MEDYAFIFMVDLCISHLPPFTDMSQRGKSEENPIMGHSPPPLYWCIMGGRSEENPITGHMYCLYNIQLKWWLWDYESVFEQHCMLQAIWLAVNGYNHIYHCIFMT